MQNEKKKKRELRTHEDANLPWFNYHSSSPSNQNGFPAHRGVNAVYMEHSINNNELKSIF